MNELALFAGSGGGLLGSRLLGWRTVCYVEHDPYCAKVIRARIKDGYLDDAPIWDDCFTFDGRPWRGVVDIISAGFPCQPFSNAGKGLAENDPRNGWPAVKRIIGEIRPGAAWLENVPGLISKPYIRRIFGDLAALGYDAEWGTLSAASVGAWHLRERLWILAYPHGEQGRLSQQPRTEGLEAFGGGEVAADSHGNQHQSHTFANQRAIAQELLSNSAGDGWQPRRESDAEESKEWREPDRSGISPNVPDSDCAGREEQRGAVADATEYQAAERGSWWSVEPGLGRVANGVAHRVDRLAAIGNGQVPEVARTAWRLLVERAQEL